MNTLQQKVMELIEIRMDPNELEYLIYGKMSNFRYFGAPLISFG